ncbi:MAG: hypothetical protein HPY54_13460 [Chthonomonadetes bacterium]|nr:hypothetical protein [Chthonomonadetes bacterium]
MQKQVERIRSPRYQRHWRLTGKEFLLELEFLDGSKPHGIYALDPFADRPQPQILIPGGQRPVWSLARDYFAYLYGGWLRVVRRENSLDALYAEASFETGTHEPIVQWTPGEGFIIVDRNPSYGSIACPVETTLSVYGKDMKDIYQGAVMGRYFIPLRRPGALGGGEREWYPDLLTANNLTCSPDGRHFAAEVYPTPLDLCRSQSRIYIYERDYYSGKGEAWYYQGLVLSKPGRRLTRLNGPTCELNPLWNPSDEQWIAFTVVDFKEAYIAPAVVHPDGSDLKFLVSHEHPDGSIAFDTSRWTEIGLSSIPAQKVRRRAMIAMSGGWGRPHIQAIQWSPDGRYLLLNEWRRYGFLSVVKREGNRWLARSAWGETYLRLVQWSSHPGWLVRVPEIVPRGYDALLLSEYPAMIKMSHVETEEHRTINLGYGVVVHWLSA